MPRRGRPRLQCRSSADARRTSLEFAVTRAPAVALDPTFPLCWALLCYVDSISYLSFPVEPTIALRDEARQAAEMALTLRPDLGEAMLAEMHNRMLNTRSSARSANVSEIWCYSLEPSLVVEHTRYNPSRSRQQLNQPAAENNPRKDPRDDRLRRRCHCRHRRFSDVALPVEATRKNGECCSCPNQRCELRLQPDPATAPCCALLKVAACLRARQLLRLPDSNLSWSWFLGTYALQAIRPLVVCAKCLQGQYKGPVLRWGNCQL
jgi:hypothetical protein